MYRTGADQKARAIAPLIHTAPLTTTGRRPSHRRWVLAAVTVAGLISSPLAAATGAATVTGCTGTTVQCGAWQVQSYNSPVRAIHSVVLNGGKVLLIAGSGLDPTAFAAGSFKSSVWDPVAGTFSDVSTPFDFFCAGHVQLSDGRVLVAGGTTGYPNSSHGFLGLNTSYIFDPSRNAYTPVNNLNDGHWYPSATELGNGDVVTLGGQGSTGKNTAAIEYFSTASQQWLPTSQIPQTGARWGLYPTMILMADGRLFYTGSHVFGAGLAGTGASTYNYTTGTITDVAGLRNKDTRDQSMSLLLPPAQAQKVAIFGGGTSDPTIAANNLVDIIDLSQPSPTYVSGPNLPPGVLSDGTVEPTGEGKMYVSAVLLPDGTVLETGGGLHKRADPVYEASLYDPVANTFTPVASDPVARLYHSEALLLPDGRVATLGSQPKGSTFEMRISIYSPPYLFKGTRPIVTAVAPSWGYGSTQTATASSPTPIVRAELIRPAAVTHSSDPNQRFVDLPLTVSGTTVSVNVPSNPNLLPPGNYMLFLLNSAGVPSVASWVNVGSTTQTVPPGSPTNVTATAGGGQATVTWNAPANNGGGQITGYTVTSSPGGVTTSVNGSTLTANVSPLTNGTSFTFTVTAANSAGPGSASQPSNAVTPTASTIPGPPVSVTAKAGSGLATVTWNAPANNGGSQITGYTVTSSPGGVTASVNGSTLTADVSPLTNGTPYTFTVTATNGVGSGSASQPSTAVTPTASTVPGPPLSVTAKAAPGHTATVSWVPPISDGGSPISGYTATSAPGGLTTTVGGGSVQAVVTGLTAHVTYTFTVVAANANGPGTPSAPSIPVTPR